MLSVFLVSIRSVLIIITIIVIGFILEKINMFNASFSGNISKLIINIALPLSIFLSTQKYITHDNIVILSYGTGLIMIAILICFLLSAIVSKLLNLPPQRTALFINGFVNSNTLFVGLPLNIALFGNSSLPYFLAYFIANTIATWGIGVKIINNSSLSKSVSNNEGDSKSNRFLKILTPPMWGFMLGLIFFLFNLSLPDFLTTSFGYLSNLVTPLSLLFLGLVLGNTKLSKLKLESVDLFAQLGKFVISPLIMFLIIFISQKLGFFYLNTTFKETLIIQSATPMLTLLPMLAEQAKLDVSFSTRILTESILIFPVIVVLLMTCFEVIPF
ncbi:AEC family transporter [Lentilactobacillus diolivorans]|uniref:AEC family transporter n=1 Tax=Lentilactobacillus diolivorans TaxID=179838 RepID=UPI000AF50DA1|nr:AEC family transporter [Lentilactobacillus diolivorans]